MTECPLWDRDHPWRTPDLGRMKEQNVKQARDKD